jgi:hypothetical protein
LGGATIGKTMFLCVYIEKNLLQKQQANFNKTWYKLILGKGNSKLYKSSTRSFQRGDNHKNAKMGRCHLKIFFSRTTEAEELIFT